MSDVHFREPFPRGVLWAAGLLLGTAILAAGVGRWTGAGTVRMPESRPIVTALLAFEDRPDGSVAVFEVNEGSERARYAPGDGGFVRGVLRGLARERKRQGLDHRTPFELTRWEDGRLSLSDLATGRRVEIDAFGPDNVRPFLALLEPEG